MVTKPWCLGGLGAAELEQKRWENPPDSAGMFGTATVANCWLLVKRSRRNGGSRMEPWGNHEFFQRCDEFRYDTCLSIYVISKVGCLREHHPTDCEVLSIFSQLESI